MSTSVRGVDHLLIKLSVFLLRENRFGFIEHKGKDDCTFSNENEVISSNLEGPASF